MAAGVDLAKRDIFPLFEYWRNAFLIIGGFVIVIGAVTIVMYELFGRGERW